MTRLVADDIVFIADTLTEYDEDLCSKTGHSLRGLACHALGLDEAWTLERFSRLQAEIVPLSWGKGLIPGFAAGVAAILNQIGLTAAVTSSINVAGLMEAFEKQCDLIFLSDDDDFSVFNLNQKTSVPNAAATGRGFAAGLDLMAGGISGQRALVIGCGPVGASAAAELAHRGARVSLFDSDPARCRALVEMWSGVSDVYITAAKDFESSVQRHSYIVDATPVSGILTADMIGSQTVVAAPGMPCGLTPRAIKKIGKRLLHDPLQIGVATMAVAAIGRGPMVSG